MTPAFDGNGSSRSGGVSTPPMDAQLGRYSRPQLTWLLVPLLLVYLLAGHPQAQPLLHEQQELHRYLLDPPALRRHENRQDDLDRRLNIFGADGRALVKNSSAFPYSAIGLLRWSQDVSCTASLVDDSYVLTAAECVLNASGNLLASTLTKAEFLPGFGNDPSVRSTSDNSSGRAGAVAKAYVVRVHKQSDYWKKWTQNTYVLLELDQPLGATRGNLLLPSLSDLDESIASAPVQFVGYDDKAVDLSTAKMEFERCTCYFPSTFNGQKYMLHHNCDTSSTGSPGAPLLVRYANLQTYILGIHTNAIGSDRAGKRDGSTITFNRYSDERANRGVLTPFVQQHLQYLKQQDAVTSTVSGSATATSSMADTSSSSSLASSSASEQIDKASSTSSGPDNSAAPETQQDPDSSANSQETSATTGHERIAPAAAYICIAFICLAWACILFIAIRHIRHQSDTERRSEH